MVEVSIVLYCSTEDQLIFSSHLILQTGVVYWSTLQVVLQLHSFNNKFIFSINIPVLLYILYPVIVFPLQAVNFSLVPPVARTVFVGGVALTWTVFLCHFRQLKSDTEPSSSS